MTSALSQKKFCRMHSNSKYKGIRQNFFCDTSNDLHTSSHLGTFGLYLTVTELQYPVIGLSIKNTNDHFSVFIATSIERVYPRQIKKLLTTYERVEVARTGCNLLTTFVTSRKKSPSDEVNVAQIVRR
jgi:hypothetical protein